MPAARSPPETQAKPGDGKPPPSPQSASTNRQPSPRAHDQADRGNRMIVERDGKRRHERGKAGRGNCENAAPIAATQLIDQPRQQAQRQPPAAARSSAPALAEPHSAAARPALRPSPF